MHFCHKYFFITTIYCLMLYKNFFKKIYQSNLYTNLLGRSLVYSLNTKRYKDKIMVGKFFKKSSFLVLAICLIESQAFVKFANNLNFSKIRYLSKALFTLISTYKLIF